MSLTESERQFGDSRFTGDDDGFYNKLIADRVNMLATSHGCPIPYGVVEEYSRRFGGDNPNSTDDEIKEGGMRLAERRYAECNFWFGYVASRAEKLNSNLHTLLTTLVKRLDDEPVGEHEVNHVPESHETEMSPMSTPWGYAIPRVIIEQIGNDRNSSPIRFQKALDIIDEVVLECETPIKLVIRLSEQVSKMDANAERVLYHLLSNGIYQEENCKVMFREIIKEIDMNAPLLASAYFTMPINQAKKLDLVDPNL